MFLESISEKRMSMALRRIFFTAHEDHPGLLALVGHIADFPTKSWESGYALVDNSLIFVQLFVLWMTP